METLRLKPRQPVVDELDNWDDDDFDLIDDDLTFRSGGSNAASLSTNRRDSHSSFRSERESIQGEEKYLHLPGDDEKSTLDAIAAAKQAGIPIPSNVPPSALMGGTIKRLGGRKIKKIISEDWGDDLVLPNFGQALQIKPQDSSKFPEVLRQVSSSTQGSPVKLDRHPPTMPPPAKKDVARLSTFSSISFNLDRYRDDEDDDVFGDGAATIKLFQPRNIPRPVSLITPPTPQKKEEGDGDDDFEMDLELPSDGKLKLSKRKEIPKTPSMSGVDDFEWGEGSLGTRFGGTRRDGRSNRSSSASALSPSIASSITAESEDENLDGLELPIGPLDFQQRLQKRRPSPSPTRRPISPPQPPAPAPVLLAQTLKAALPIKAQEPPAEREDFLSGLDIGNGEVFDSSKLTLNRNIKLKETRTGSPTRPKTAVSITFTNKPTTSNISRLPRPMVSHERTHTASSLEPVSESGGPITRNLRRSQSRLGHSAQSSVTSLPTPTTPSSGMTLPPSTPRHREIGQKSSTLSLRNEPTTTNAQLLRLKRSLPVMRPAQTPARPFASRGYDRPPSRTDSHSRPQSFMRPKTPVERTRAGLENAAAHARRNPLPFIPAGASSNQSQHIANKNSRVFRRHDSDTVVDLRPSSRAVSRSTIRSPSPHSLKHRSVDGFTRENVWQQLSRPKSKRNFGEGHELDGFDDLPTSAQAESRFIRAPATGPKAQLRNKLYQSILPDRNSTPSPMTPSTPTPYSPAKTDHLPRFARDTAASRIARETALAQRAPPTGPLAPLTTQRVAQLSSRNPNINTVQSPHSTLRAAKKLPKRPPQMKPHLIAHLNPTRESKVVKGMVYNPDTYRWEGNENALGAFDAPASSPSTASVPTYMLREKENATPRPALITPMGATKGVQVVGGMVFDPQNMCWLKIAPQGTPGTNGKSDENDTMDGFDALDDEDDVFKDIPDLEDSNGKSADGGHGRVSDIKDDWMVGEEFDVGPAFVRRQREEEARWKAKCEKWLSPRPRDRTAWGWTIRDIVLGVQQ